MSEGQQSRGLVLSALALALFVGAMVWALMGPGNEQPLTEPAHEEGEPEEATQHVANAPPDTREPAPAPAVPAKPAVDLFAGEMPDFMAETHARVLDKKPLGVVDQKKIHEYGKANPNDARPQLLLAWDSINREWDGIGVRMYKIAYRADPRVKDDPRMLEDLLHVAATHDKVEYRETLELVKDVYGSDAIGAIEQTIEEHAANGKAKSVERLTLLRDVLKGEAQAPTGPDRRRQP
jgi:hypothetical protein